MKNTNVNITSHTVNLVSGEGKLETYDESYDSTNERGTAELKESALNRAMNMTCHNMSAHDSVLSGDSAFTRRNEFKGGSVTLKQNLTREL